MFKTFNDNYGTFGTIVTFCGYSETEDRNLVYDERSFLVVSEEEYNTSEVLMAVKDNKKFLSSHFYEIEEIRSQLVFPYVNTGIETHSNTLVAYVNMELGLSL